MLLTGLLSEYMVAQSIARLMQSVRHYDYYHTILYARSMLKKKKKLSAGAYALAYVYYQPFQPFHHLDSAYKYIHLSVLNYPHKPYRFSDGMIDSTVIYQLYDSITYAQFMQIATSIQPRVYDRFMSTHPFMSEKIRTQIRQHQYDKVLEYAHSINKSDTTFYLMAQYNEHPHLSLLQQLLDKQLFTELTKHQTAAEYLLFLKNYPKSTYRETALQSLLDIYIKEKNTTGLKQFATEFSQDKFYSEQAWKWLFAYSVKWFSNEELEKFMTEYPAFPFKKEIMEEMEMNAKVLIPFSDTSGSIGFIDTSGRFIIPPVYDAVTPFRENIALVFRNDSAFFINKKNQRIISRVFQDAYPFYNGYAPVFDGTHWYFINRLGVKQSDTYDWINERSYDNNYVIKKNNLYGLCDYKGQILLSPTFEKLGDFENHMAYYTENGLYGLVEDNGKKYPAKYQWISSVINQQIIVKQNNLYGIINMQNETILPVEYDFIFHCTEDIYLVVKNKKYGYFKANERCFIYHIQWDFSKNTEVKIFTNGEYFKLIAQNKVYVGHKNGWRLNNNKPFQDAVISSHYILLKNKNKWGLFYKNKNILPSFLYTQYTICENKILIVQRNDAYYILDTLGNKLYETKNSLTHIIKNYYFEKDGDNGKIIDMNGQVIATDVESYTSFEKYLIFTHINKRIRVIE